MQSFIFGFYIRINPDSELRTAQRRSDKAVSPSVKGHTEYLPDPLMALELTP